MIVFRYLTKEVFHTLVAITGILLLVFLSNLFIRYLGYAASGNFPVSMVFKFVVIQIPYLLALLLPLSFFISVLLAYGRLYSESEMTVLLACGMSQSRLVKMTCGMAIGLALFIGMMSFWINPQLLTYRNNLLAQAREDASTEILFPGSFQELNNGAQVAYVESLDGTRNHAENVFLAMRSGSNKSLPEASMLDENRSEWTIVTAKTAYREVDPQYHAQFAVLTNGHRYVGTPGQANYSTTIFDKFGFRLSKKEAAPSKKEENLSTPFLWENRHDRPQYLAELQWRAAMPVAMVILAILSVSLSRVDPRKGKYTQLLPATAVAIVYANLLFVARSWGYEENSSLPWFGIWGVHVMFLSLSLILLINRKRFSHHISCLIQRLQQRLRS